MGKAKTLLRRKKSSKEKQNLRFKKGAKIKKHDPDRALLNENLIAKAIWECLKENDSEGVIEIIKAHLEAISKYEISRKAKIPRSTIYSVLKSKNPTLKTIAKIIHAVG